MSHLSNPLATANQLSKGVTNNGLPPELQDSIRFYTARLTQAAGILLRLPQDITAQANVLLFRYWLVDDIMSHDFDDLSAAVIYLTAKISASPRSLRSIINVYGYLLSSHSALKFNTPDNIPERIPSSYYVTDTRQYVDRARILLLEGQVLHALGFDTHVALPHPLCITYLQTLDVFRNVKVGQRVAKKAVAYLNSALLSPQMLYLTHQPAQLATAAAYLASKEEGVKLPDVEWWEVFDCEREDLGFLVVALGSLEGVVRREVERWEMEKGTLSRKDIGDELRKMGRGEKGWSERKVVDDEKESEMARRMDGKVLGPD